MHNFSGVRTYIDELSEYLIRQENVSVYHVYLNNKSIREFKIEETNKITSIYIPNIKTNKSQLKYYKRAVQLLYSYFYSLQSVVLHINFTLHGCFAEEFKKLFRSPIVFTLHYLENFYSYMDCISGYKEEISISGNVNLKNLLNTADRIICVTRFGQRAITKFYTVNHSQTSVIYNGKRQPDLSLDTKNAIKKKFGFLAKDRVIIYVGQLEDRKGLDKLISAFKLLKDQYRSLKLLIVGTGSFDVYMPLAQDCIGRVCFTGKLDMKTLSDFYRFSELGIIPSRFEQCSYVVLEMLQHGLPIIISDVPGLNELIINNKTGLLCKTQPDLTIPSALTIDYIDLANQIKYLIDNKKIAQEYSKAGMDVAKTKHSLEKMGASTLNIYKLLLKKVREE